MTKILTNKEKYHLLLWTPFEVRHYGELPLWLKDELDKIKEEAKSNFETWFVKPNDGVYEVIFERLKNKHEKPTVLVSYSGSGKTTNLYVLLEEFNRSKENERYCARYEVFDMLIRGTSTSSSHDWNDWIELRCVNKDKSPRVLFRQFIIMLINDLNRSLCIEGSEPNKEQRENLERIVDNYEKIFYDEAELYSDIFATLKKYLTGSVCYQNPLEAKGSASSYLIDTKRYIFDACRPHVDGEEPFYDYIDQTAKRLLTLYFIIRTCTIPTEKIKSGNFVYSVAFDNIEHFFRKDIVQDNDVKAIIKLLHEYIEESDTKESAFFKLFHFVFPEDHVPQHEKPKGFSRFFNIMIAVRETTYVMTGKAKVDDIAYANEYIDMTRSSDINEILRKKFSFYRSHNINVFHTTGNDDVESAIHAMLSDKPQRGIGVWHRITSMYSHNIRRIVHNLIEAFSGKRLSLTAYKTLHEKVVSRNSDTADEVKELYQYASRQIIYRLIWNLTFSANSEENIFNKLDKFPDMGRKLAVYLSNYKQGDFVKFTTVLETLLIGLCNNKKISQIDEAELSLFAEVISAMRERRMDWHWAPLILLRYNDTKPFSASSMAGILKKIVNGECAEIDGDNALFGLKVTFAGRCFAEYSNEFEYFASKYSIDKRPLFCYDGIQAKAEMREMITLVRAKAISEIHEVVTYDEDIVRISDTVVDYNRLYTSKYFFDASFNPYSTERNHNLQPLPYPVRIIRSHVGCLDDFRVFLLHKHKHLISTICEKLDITLSELRQFDFNELYINIQVFVEQNCDDRKTRDFVELVTSIEHIVEEIDKYIAEYKSLTEHRVCDFKVDDKKMIRQNYVGGENRNKAGLNVEYTEITGQYAWYEKRILELRRTPLMPVLLGEL